jgi:hypothetical protein
MTKQPSDLATWLSYHHHIGVARFYLRVENTPELAGLLSQEPWSHVVEATFSQQPTQRHYIHQTSRQCEHLKWAIARARRQGLTHILHIDDDELLYCPGGLERLLVELQAAPPNACDLHMRNLEALASSDESDDPFREVVAFRHDTRFFGAYLNGKAFGRLADRSLRSSGPHGFYLDGAEERHSIHPWTAVVLHYESVTWSSWKRKFLDLALTHSRDGDIGDKPLYYRESIEACRKLRRAMESAGDSGESGGSTAPSSPTLKEAEAAAAAVWARWRKLEPPHDEGLTELAAAGASREPREPVVLSGGITLVQLPAFPTIGQHAQHAQHEEASASARHALTNRCSTGRLHASRCRPPRAEWRERQAQRRPSSIVGESTRS